MSNTYAYYPVRGGSGGVTSVNSLTGALTLAAGTGISITDDGSHTITIASTSAGDVTLTAFGSTPNANGASLAAQALTLQPADGTHPGGVSILAQSFGGDKTFVNKVFISDGLVSAPSLAFTSSTNSGLYASGTNKMAFAVNGAQVLDTVKSSGGFGNLGMGVTASVSDSYPLLIQRAVTSAGVYIQVSNTDTAASSKASFQLSADAGNNNAEVSLFTSVTGTDAYANSMTVRPSGNTAHLTLIGGDLSTADVRFYVAGDYTATGRAAQFNADKSLQLMQAIATPSSPAAGTIKLFQSSGNLLSVVNSAGAVSSLSGVNTGDVTIGTANGLSLSAQALSLALASTSTVGALSATDWNTFNGKAAAGSYITALTGDVTASGPGSAAASLAGTISGAKIFSTSLQSPIFKSSTANPAAAGVIRLANTDIIGFRNAANSLDKTITLNASDLFAFSAGVTPAADNTQNLGSATNRWANVTQINALFYGTSSGVITMAAQAAAGTYNLNLPTTAGTAGQVLTSQAGGSAAMTWTTPVATVYAPRSIQVLTSGSTYNKDYTFVITSGSATVGATYTNNSITYTVNATVASAVQVVMHGSGAPTASGTLTKSGGTGDATLTFSQVLAPLYLKIRMVGGGGGGGGAGATTGPTGSNGGDTTFSTLTAGGGAGGASFGSIGGTATGGDINIPGAFGANSGAINGVTVGYSGYGGNSAFGGGGPPGVYPAGGGGAGITNSGGGGGGATGSVLGNNSNGGGGAGGYVEKVIILPSATYSYGVGASGAGGIGTGTNAATGGAGAAGIIIVEAYYQ